MSMADFAGKVCVITGGTSGIGLGAAEKLAAMGAELVIVGRDPARAAAANARLSSIGRGAGVTVIVADLAVLSEQRRVAETLARLPRIDVLLNNAGAIFSRRTETPDGLERTFALNHMGYYVLTRLLEEKLRNSAPMRIVNVASGAHHGARLDLDDLQMTRRFDGWLAYRNSKLCNILFTRELARRLAGSGITTNCLHPGFVATRFGDNNRGLFRAGVAIAKRFVAIPVAKGAETPVFCATAPELDGVSGRYFGACHEQRPSAAAQDDQAALRLWQASARIAGLPV
jgi:NAD(P)-dependent dehydrogenase (short-subunit alcohol dehydrogenase family)